MLIKIKNWKREKNYYNNKEKIIDLEKNRRNIHKKKEINELNIKIQTLAKAMEALKSTISVA